MSNSSGKENNFILQKNVGRVVCKVSSRAHRELFNKFDILTVTGNYIQSLMLFVISNNHLLMTYSDMHNFNTRNGNNFYKPGIAISITQEWVHYNGINIFKKLPDNVKRLKNIKPKF